MIGTTLAHYEIKELLGRGNRDATCKWLDIAHQEKDSGLTLTRISRMLKSLHADPRWPKFLKKAGFEEDG